MAWGGEQSGYDIRLEIDGGVSVANIGSIAEAGVDMFVAGSAILKAPRTTEAYKETIDSMRAELAKCQVCLCHCLVFPRVPLCGV